MRLRKFSAGLRVSVFVVFTVRISRARVRLVWLQLALVLGHHTDVSRHI